MANNNQKMPIVDYSVLFSDDGINHLSHVCQDYSFFCLVNHGVPDVIFSRVLGQISDFFNPTAMDDRRQYERKNPTDRIRWGISSCAGENRENLKVVIHPKFHCPPKPITFSEALQDYSQRLKEIELGLAKAMSKALGFEESFMEKTLNLKSGFDVFATNLYPPSSKSHGSVGLADHTDPGIFVSLIQDGNGGLQVLSHDGEWVEINMPPNAIFIIFSDHLEILTNGKYKSCVHRVMLGGNKERRISATTLHGPSLETVVEPACELYENSGKRKAYRGVTFKHSLVATGFDEVDVKSTLRQARLPPEYPT